MKHNGVEQVRADWNACGYGPLGGSSLEFRAHCSAMLKARGLDPNAHGFRERDRAAYLEHAAQKRRERNRRQRVARAKTGEGSGL